MQPADYIIADVVHRVSFAVKDDARIAAEVHIVEYIRLMQAVGGIFVADLSQ